MAAEKGNVAKSTSGPTSVITEQKLREIFDNLDKDKDGKLGSAELSEGFRQLGVPNAVHSTKVSDTVHSGRRVVLRVAFKCRNRSGESHAVIVHSSSQRAGHALYTAVSVLQQYLHIFPNYLPPIHLSSPRPHSRSGFPRQRRHKQG